MFLGPVFEREAAVAPRQFWLYAGRSLYAFALLLVMCTGWLVLAGAQMIRNIGDFARFGSLIFQVLAPLQLTLAIFYAAFVAANAVAHEKDRRTIILLLMTELTDAELVLGKLGASLLHVYSVLLAGLPLFALCALFGGVAFEQVGRVFLITCTTALLAGSVGTLLAFWLDKSVQALAGTALAMVLWLGLGEAVHSGAFASLFGSGIDWRFWGAAVSPLRAVLAASQPTPVPADLGLLARAADFFLPIWPYLAFTLGGSVVFCLTGIVGLRIWNPSREEYRQPVVDDLDEPAIGTSADDQARAGHVDSRLRHATRGDSRAVWDNPVLWRETQTWAHGQKILGIRAVYYLLAILAGLGLYLEIQSGSLFVRGDGAAALIPIAARYLVPLMLVSLVILNALAVTSVTGERDGMAIDLLLATDIDPGEFVFGKVGGTLWVGADLLLVPILLLLGLWGFGGISFENLIYVVLGFLCLALFSSTLGLHCGLSYASSREAIGLSLGTLFFLFLGVATCMLLMVAFVGSFEAQYAQFYAFIIGGSIALFAVLGGRNPSSAIGLASILLPVITFVAFTSFVLGYTLGVLIEVAFAYGFATVAMLIPAIDSFDIAMGRSAAVED